MTIASIYFDHATATRPSDHVIGKMVPYLSEYWGSSTSPHRMGQRLLPAMEDAYEAIYSMLGASEKDSFILTSSAAEAINHVIRSVYYDVTRPKGRNHFITAATDEAPAILAVGHLEPLGCVGKMAQVTAEGYVTAETIADSLTPRTALVSLSWANGLTGVVNPIGEISDLCRERGVLLHLDASHVLGKLYFELDDIGADFITFGADQLHGPKGAGGLWIKSGVKLSPMIVGGIQQGGLRAGDPNVPALVGMGVAAQELVDSRDLMCTEVARLRNLLEEGIVEGCPDAVPFFRDEERLPHITAIAFPGISNEALLYALDRKKLYCSMGGGSFQQIGLVLAASDVPEVLAHSSLSFALARTTVEEEVERAVNLIVETVNQMRKFSEHIALP